MNSEHSEHSDISFSTKNHEVHEAVVFTASTSSAPSRRKVASKPQPRYEQVTLSQISDLMIGMPATNAQTSRFATAYDNFEASTDLKSVVTKKLPQTSRIEPILKWPGGKRRLVPDLLACVPESYGAYHEPFLGGAALFFALRPEAAYLSDMNERLIRMYIGVRDDVEAVIAHLARWPRGDCQFKAVKEAYNERKGDAALTAAQLIYLSKTGFNGLYRENRQGLYNVSYGDYDPEMPTFDADHLRTASDMLVGQHLVSQNYADVESRAQEGDLVYFDPPYLPLTGTANFSRYVNGPSFPMSEHVRLRDLFLRLKMKGVHVIVSNSSAPAVYELYGGSVAKITEVGVARTISRGRDTRKAVKELIIH